MDCKMGTGNRRTNRTQSNLVKANQQARASTLDHNEAIKAQTLSAKAHKAALQALATIGNMALMYGATKLIGAFIGFIDGLHTTFL